MPKKRYQPEDIINKLRVAEVELSKGHTTGQICRKPHQKTFKPGKAKEYRNICKKNILQIMIK